VVQASATTSTAPRNPVDFLVDRIWRFYCSVRAAVYEIIILAVIVLLGTLRGSSVPQSIKDHIPFTGGIVDRWYDYDFFHSVPLMLILAQLSIAITICTMNRAPGIWRTIQYPKVDTTHGFLNGADVSAAFSIKEPRQDLAAATIDMLKQKRFRVLTEERGDETHIYADKNRWAKLGTFPFHLALIMILIGGIVGARYGFRDTEFVIPEGSVRDIGHDTGLSVELIQFSDSYSENATPMDYRSQVAVYKNGEIVKTGDVRVNHPLKYGTTVIYQSSFGQAATMKITDDAGNILYSDSIPLGLYFSTTNPDAPAGVQDLPAMGYRLNVIGPNNALDGRPEVKTATETIQLEPGQMYIQLIPINQNAASSETLTAVLDQGTAKSIGGINIEFVRETRFSNFQVARNPGIPIFFAAAFLLVGGLIVTFYFPHRRVRAIVSNALAAKAGSTIKAAPLAKRDWSGQRDFFHFVDGLQERLEVDPVVKGRTVEQT
jgi:cytochrome c biogenesis protein